jgi:hypothetical protein
MRELVAAIYYGEGNGKSVYSSQKGGANSGKEKKLRVEGAEEHTCKAYYHYFKYYFYQFYNTGFGTALRAVVSVCVVRNP